MLNYSVAELRFITIEQFTQGRVGVSTRILDYEEREEHEEVEYLQSGELAVLFLLYSNLAGAYIYMFHHTHNALNCTIIVIFCEKASQI